MTADEATRGAQPNQHEPSDILDEFFRLSPDLLCVVDSGGLFVRLSDAWTSVMGYGPGELIGKRALTLLHPDDVERTVAAWRLTAQAPQMRDLVNRFRCKDDSWRWLEWSGSSNRGLSYAAARDITERKQAEDRLRQSDRLLQTVIDGITDPIFAKDNKGRYLFVNEASARFADKSAAEILGKDDTEIFPPDDAQFIVARDRRVMASGATSTELETLSVARGERGTFLATKGPIVDSAGDVVGLFGISRDITAQVHAEQALRESEQRFQEFMDRMPAVCFIKDSKNRMVYLNRTLIRDFQAADWLGKTVRDLFPPEQAAELERTDEQVKDTGEPVEFEHLMRMNGELRSFVTQKFRMLQDGVPFVGSISFDVTDRVRAEQALRESEERFEEFMNRLPAACFIKDSENRMLYMNPAFVRTFKARDWVGKTSRDVFPPEQAAVIERSDRHVVETGEPIEVEQRVRVGGEMRSFVTQKFPMRAEGKKIGRAHV